MEHSSEGLPEVGRVYVSKEKRSLGKKVTVIDPAPARHGFTHLQWGGGVDRFTTAED